MVLIFAMINVFIRKPLKRLWVSVVFYCHQLIRLSRSKQLVVNEKKQD